MSQRKVYHITKTDTGWQAKQEQGNKASVVGRTKEEVVEKAIELAKKQENASLKIHKKDGTFQEERTYPKKSDPFPPAG